MTNKPEPELIGEVLLIKEMMKLPVREDSSAIARVDLWAVADLFAQHQTKTLDSLLSKLPKVLPIDPIADIDYRYAVGFNECHAEVKSIIEEMK